MSHHLPTDPRRRIPRQLLNQSVWRRSEYFTTVRPEIGQLRPRFALSDRHFGVLVTMKHVNFFLFVLILIGGAFIYFQNLAPRKGGGAGGGMFFSNTVSSSTESPLNRSGEAIRIATFNLHVFGTTKSRKVQVVDHLANICRRFDVVALQEIVSADQDILPRLVEQMNANYRTEFDYVIGPRLGDPGEEEQYAFLFDRKAVEVDRGYIHTIEDNHDLLKRDPLVASFRVRGPKPEDAFTFTLVNVRVDPNNSAREMSIMDDVFLAVRGNGSGEDDVILLGDFNVDDRNYGELGKMAGMSWAISGIPTNTEGTHQFDNLLFAQSSTREYLGRGGVFDFMREFNLTLQQALEISDHVPVWAEFSVYEDGVPGRVANAGEATKK